MNTKSSNERFKRTILAIGLVIFIAVILTEKSLFSLVALFVWLLILLVWVYKDPSGTRRK